MSGGPDMEDQRPRTVRRNPRRRLSANAALLAGPEQEELRHHRESLAAIRLRAQRLRRVLESGASDTLLWDATSIAAEIATELRATNPTTSGAAAAAAAAASANPALAHSAATAGRDAVATPASSLSDLNPRLYYEIYLAVTAELRVFEVFLTEAVTRTARHKAPAHGTASTADTDPVVSVLELYERAQTTLSVVPRLYVLITVAGVYLRSAQAPARDILRDLSEMCCGVQHPQRGLFLRAYLAQTMMRDMSEGQRLAVRREEDTSPGTSLDREHAFSEEVHGETINKDESCSRDRDDAVEFLLRNFTEMNRLWVRMEHDCPAKERERREEERKELRLLVGINISKLALVPGVSVELYRKTIFPAVAEQIVSCHDPIAQEYLCDCLVQVFPDDYLLQTLDSFLEMCSKLTRAVDLRAIVGAVTTRLSTFAQSSKQNASVVRKARAFELLQSHLPEITESAARDGAMNRTDRLTVYLSLLQFAIAAYPDQFECVDIVYSFCVSALTNATPTSNGLEEISLSTSEKVPQVTVLLGSPLESLIVELLELPFTVHHNVSVPLYWDHWLPLGQKLCCDTRRKISMTLMKAIDDFVPCLASVDKVDKLFDFIAPLVEPDQSEETQNSQRSHRDTVYHPFLFPDNNNQDAEEISRPTGAAGLEGGQRLISRIVFLLEDANPSRHFALCKTLRSRLARGGSARGRVTLPPLIHTLLRLSTRIFRSHEDPILAREVLVYANETISGLAKADAEFGLRLFLKGAVASSVCNFEDESLGYDFISHAFLVFEEDLVGSRSQFTALLLISGTLNQVRNSIPGPAFDSLVARAVRHSSRLLTKADQCLALCAAAVLYWPPPPNGAEGDSTWGDPEALVHCLDSATMAARSCMSHGERALLLLDVIVRSMYFVECGCPAAGGARLSVLVKEVSDLLEDHVRKDSLVGKIISSRLARSGVHLKV